MYFILLRMDNAFSFVSLKGLHTSDVKYVYLKKKKNYFKSSSESGVHTGLKFYLYWSMTVFIPYLCFIFGD
jgi:hypothetical protein